MAGWYQLKHSGDKFMFNLVASNGQVVLTSQMYANRAGAEKGIASVQANCADAGRFESKVSAAGQPYFVLKAANGQVIGTSQMYKSEASRDNGIHSVQANGASTAIRDEA